MDMITLKNGSEEAKILVAAIMMSLKGLAEEKPLALYELNELCKDSSHEVWGDLIDDLRDLNLVDRAGAVHSSIRHVVLSACGGVGMDLVLGSPV